ncbi:MAG: hypothetical protein M1828_005180 [Chrysothrix sp. TS-e1954]|nr:MAG: hypothetical protein M1828_005180 [Chrysothrix sp. TS-e1954]
MAGSPSKPTIIFVPGAWHLPSQYSKITDQLKAASYEVNAVTLPSVVDSTSSGSAFDGDVAVIRSEITAAMPNDVVVVCHSYGGLPTSEACQGLLKADRDRQGKPGGVLTVMYICAFAATEGVSLFDAIGGKPTPWMHWEPDVEKENDPDGVLKAHTPEHVFYHDLSPEEAAEHSGRLKLHSAGSMMSPATYAVWKHVPCWYFVCEGDRAIPLVAQEMMLDQEGGRWKEGGVERTERVADGHSPFLSCPEKVVRFVTKAAG